MAGLDVATYGRRSIDGTEPARQPIAADDASERSRPHGAVFADRGDAGRRLATHCAHLAGDGTPVVVLALPRGGVPVAAPVAALLGAPLDVLVVRKIGCPWRPELGVGALGEGGVQVLDQELLDALELTPEDLAPVVAAELVELERRVAAYRGGLPPVTVDGRVAIVVDDGVATGNTARAAAAVLRERGARRTILAVPVATPASVGALEQSYDEVVALHQPHRLRAVGAAYDVFDATSDREVVALLRAHRDTPTDGPAG